MKLPDEIELGGNAKPAAIGNWGHFTVGGVRTQCHENERIYQDYDTCFCQEPYADIQQGVQDDGVNTVPRVGPRRGGRDPEPYLQFRPLDWATLVNHRRKVLDWVGGYKVYPWYQEPEMMVSENIWNMWASSDHTRANNVRTTFRKHCSRLRRTLNIRLTMPGRH